MALSEYTETSLSALVERWQRGYATRLLLTDLVVLIAVVYGSQFLRFGADAADQTIAQSEAQRLEITYSLFSALLILAWLAALALFGTRDQKIVGSGSTEYKRIADATIRVFGVLAIIAFLLQTPLGRGYLLIALPTGLALLLASRWLWRQWLNRRRAAGEYSYRAILMGERSSSAHVARQITRDPSNGFIIVGAVTQGGSTEALAPGVPVIGSFDRAIEAVDASEADTVVFTGADTITPRQLRQFGWELQARSINLIVAPALTDVAGPRIHARPVAGLPLIHVDYPGSRAANTRRKRAFDLIASSGVLVLLSPLLLVLGILVRSDSRGPVLFRQERVGRNGRRFRMLKFRTMVVDAEEQLPSLLEQREGNGVLFKLKTDPRVTKSARCMRRYSLDELPQLLNVLRATCRSSARDRRSPPRSSATTSPRTAGCSSSRASPACGRSSGRSHLVWDEACASTSTTSRTGR